MTDQSLIVHPAATVPACLEGRAIPAVLGDAGPDVLQRFVTFFAAHIENDHTADAYARAVFPFLRWCDAKGLALTQLQAVHVSAYLKGLKEGGLADTSLKARLSALRSLFSFLVQGGLLRLNPAHDVRTPKVRRREGKTPHLDPAEMRILLDSMADGNLASLRDRALIATMAYAFPRISTALLIKVGEFERAGSGYAFYLHGKGGEEHRHAAHHEAAKFVLAWIEAAELEDPGAPLFQSVKPARGQKQTATGRALTRSAAGRMVKRRVKAAGLNPNISTHSFRVTGITAYVEAGGPLQTAAHMAGHADVRTTQLYVRRTEKDLRGEVERIRFE